ERSIETPRGSKPSAASGGGLNFMIALNRSSSAGTADMVRPPHRAAVGVEGDAGVMGAWVGGDGKGNPDMRGAGRAIRRTSRWCADWRRNGVRGGREGMVWRGQHQAGGGERFGGQRGTGVSGTC